MKDDDNTVDTTANAALAGKKRSRRLRTVKNARVYLRDVAVGLENGTIAPARGRVMVQAAKALLRAVEQEHNDRLDELERVMVQRGLIPAPKKRGG